MKEIRVKLISMLASEAKKKYPKINMGNIPDREQVYSVEFSKFHPMQPENHILWDQQMKGPHGFTWVLNTIRSMLNVFNFDIAQQVEARKKYYGYHLKIPCVTVPVGSLNVPKILPQLGER